MRFFSPHVAISFATLIMTSQSATVTRVACFRFKENVTAEQKGDRARTFLDLYEQHQDLICGMPKGGKPLNTPLNLTNVKRDSVWDTGFTVTFKVGLFFFFWFVCVTQCSCPLTQLCRAKKRALSLTRSLDMTN